MSLPENRASTAPVPSALLAPDDIERTDRRVDFEMGGVAIGDASLGVQVRHWRAWVADDTVRVAPWPELTPITALFSAAGVSELSLAFDQLMHPTIAFVQDGLAKLYWYDTLAGAQVTTDYPGVTSPVVCLDDKRDTQVLAGVTDVLFIYARAGGVWYRQQRDRFTIERSLGALPSGVSRIVSAGMGTNGRLQVNLSLPPPLHVDLESDEVFTADGTGAVRALHGGTVADARWRSRIYELAEQPSFGWAQVEASGYPVTLRLLADGLEIAAVAVPSEDPVRLPAVRGRTWQVEIVGASRVVAVRLASSRQEMEAEDA